MSGLGHVWAEQGTASKPWQAWRCVPDGKEEDSVPATHVSDIVLCDSRERDGARFERRALLCSCQIDWQSGAGLCLRILNLSTGYHLHAIVVMSWHCCRLNLTAIVLPIEQELSWLVSRKISKVTKPQLHVRVDYAIKLRCIDKWIDDINYSHNVRQRALQVE